MPFLDHNTSAEPVRSLGRVSTMRVDPAMVTQLKNDLQPIYDDVENFLLNKAEAMTVRPLGADRVSRNTAAKFNENSKAAIQAAWGYHGELMRVIATLDRSAKDYTAVEDTHEQTYRRGPA